MKHFVRYFFLIFLLILPIPCLPTIDAPEVVIGTAVPIQTKCLSNKSYFNLIQASPMISSIKSYGISLLGYDTFVSTVIFIESEITQVDSTHVTIRATCFNDLLWNKLQFSYIIVGSVVSYLDVYSECFICPTQDTIDGERTYNFNLKLHTLPFTREMSISSSISGMNISSTEQDGVHIQTSTFMKLGDKTLYHLILAQKDTVVTSICITAIIYDLPQTVSQNYRILVSIEEKSIDSTNGASFVLPYYPCFINPNSMFYGISSMKIYFQAALSQTLLFDLSNIANFATKFQGNSNINEIKLTGFFIRKLNCLPSEFFDPLSYSCVSACPSQTGPNPLTSYCEGCHQTCATCDGSGFENCKSCNNATIQKFRQLKGGLLISECECQPQYFEPSDGSVICKKCSDFIQNCQLCSNPLSCSQCFPGFIYNPVTNGCGCIDTTKYMTNGICMPYPGCTNIQSSSQMQLYCKECDTQLNFELIQANYSCHCKDGYELNPVTISCIDKCGDGRVFENQCDDGNLIDGDGCSSICKVESGWMCSTLAQPTKCMPGVTFQLQYLYCSRDITSNSGTFNFLLTPPIAALSQTNLTKSFKFSFLGKIKSYSYNSQTSKLSITTSLTQSLQNSNQKLLISFSSVGIWTDSLSTEFEVKGMNAELIIDDYSQNYIYLMYGMAMFCGVAWLLAILAAIMGYRNLSIELMLPIQAIYFVLVQQESFAPGLRALQFLKFINGYNSLQGFKTKEIISSNDRGYSYLQYTQNMNFFILVDAGCVLMLFIVKAVHFLVDRKIVALNEKLEDQNASKDMINKSKKHQNEMQHKQVTKKKTQQQTILQSKLSSFSGTKTLHLITKKLLLFIGQRFCITIVLLTVQNSIFYLGSFIIYTSEYKLFSPFINNIACLLATLLTFAGFSFYPEEKYKEVYIVFQNKLRYSYTKFFIIWYVVFNAVLVIVCSFGVKGLILLPIVLPSLIIALLVLKNPYKTENAPCLRYLLPLIQQSILTAPCILLSVVGFFHSASSFFYFILELSIAGSCILALLITILRFYFEHKYFKNNKGKLYQDNQQDQDQDQEKQESSKYDQEKEFHNQMRENLLNKGMNSNQHDNFQTIKNKHGKVSQKSENKLDSKDKQSKQENSSKTSQEQLNLEDIKKKLRKDLKTKRNVLNR